jgi:AcrR family transcriptional regulator
MNAPPDSLPASEAILDATIDILRKHGADKANVVDVAKLLGMSHANIYRHFPSKRALLDAVAARWLNSISGPLQEIADTAVGSAAGRLENWFHTMRTMKVRRFEEDPELFEVYFRVAESVRDIVTAYIHVLVAQLRRIVSDGISAGDFSPALDPEITARVLFHATLRFSHPALISRSPNPDVAEANALIALLIAGLIHQPSTAPQS